MPEAKDESKVGMAPSASAAPFPFLPHSLLPSLHRLPACPSFPVSLSTFCSIVEREFFLEIWDVALWAMSGTSLLNGATVTTVRRGYSRALHL